MIMIMIMKSIITMRREASGRATQHQLWEHYNTSYGTTHYNTTHHQLWKPLSDC